MLPFYENKSNVFELFHEHSNYCGPHLHTAIELVYVTKGQLLIGQNADYYEMTAGDFAIVFPDLIHYYQSFDKEHTTAWYLLADASYYRSFQMLLTEHQPVNPIIRKNEGHPDIYKAIESIAYGMNCLPLPESEECYGVPSHDPYSEVLRSAFLDIILARSLPLLSLNKRQDISSHDLVTQVVYYIAIHYQEPLTLSDMAHDLGCSPYTLSRLVSSTFHKNFNQYINEKRLEHATGLMRNTDQSITECYLNAGFESQRTFNRVFSEHYHMSPREYRFSLQKAPRKS